MDFVDLRHNNIGTLTSLIQKASKRSNFLRVSKQIQIKVDKFVLKI